ncbi:MAG: peptide chain release factor N(5)-glutamine methyltransferase [Syntrophaceae bacterium]|nr:peptide chain release factor N(5)-glutamine methyltransferase [Syntrophaceae bacterium]
MTVQEILNEATRELEAAGIETARLDAEVLLAFCLKCDRLEFLKNPESPITKNHLTEFKKLINRRLKWEPVAYITGRKEFWSFTLEVNKDVLIPRPDTEVIVEEVLKIAKHYESLINELPPSELKGDNGHAGLDPASRLDSGRMFSLCMRGRNDEKYDETCKIIPSVIRILDIGTGSGAIALALAKELPAAEVTATDISPAALKIAKRNARNLGLEKQIEFLKGDLFAPVKGFFDIVISNPPYISAAEYEELPEGVKDFEPRIALLAGQTGVEFYEKLIYQSKNHLKEDGWLIMEIGAPQAEKIRDIMQESGFFENIDVRRDYAGHDRVIKGRKR